MAAIYVNVKPMSSLTCIAASCLMRRMNGRDKAKKLAAERAKMFRAMLKTMTQAEIGRHFNISRERVRQILARKP